MHIGKMVTICSGVRFLSVGNCIIGDRTIINRNCVIDNRRLITIGSDVSIAFDSKILTLGHDVNSPDFALVGASVIVGDYVCVFSNSIISPGVELGYGAVVYPGAVVTRSVDIFNVVAGVPAKVIGVREQDLRYRLNGNFWFN